MKIKLIPFLLSLTVMAILSVVATLNVCFVQADANAIVQADANAMVQADANAMVEDDIKIVFNKETGEIEVFAGSVSKFISINELVRIPCEPGNSFWVLRP